MSLFSRKRSPAADVGDEPDRKARLERELRASSEEVRDRRALASVGEVDLASVLLSRVAQAARPIAVGLALRGPEGDLGKLQRTTELNDIDDRPVRRLLQTFEVLASHATRLRDANAVMKQCAADLIDALGRLVDAGSGVRDSLESIRVRLLEAKDIQDLEELRNLLVDHAASLVSLAENREEAIQRAHEVAHESQRRAEELEAALVGAEEAARTDPLTGLGNRRALDDAVSNDLPGPLGVLALDLDHFKRVNDDHGHAVGDEVLRYVADVLRGELRGDDHAFRIGGEEFVVVLPECSWQGARATAERLRARLADRPIPIGQSDRLNATMSVGVALWSGEAAFSTTLEEADAALYRAKEAGRNRVVG